MRRQAHAFTASLTGHLVPPKMLEKIALRTRLIELAWDSAFEVPLIADDVDKWS
jgi:hypothetical protein